MNHVAFYLEGNSLFSSVGNMLLNLDSSLGNIHRLIVAVAYLLGIILITSAVFSLKHFADFRNMMSSNQGDLKKAMFKILAGVGLMWIPYTLEVATMTFWGSTSPLAYQGAEGNTVLAVLYRLMKIVGLIALVRGLYLLAMGTEQGQSTTGRALTHIVGGALAYNIASVQSILRATLIGN